MIDEQIFVLLALLQVTSQLASLHADAVLWHDALFGKDVLGHLAGISGVELLLGARLYMDVGLGWAGLSGSVKAT